MNVNVLCGFGGVSYLDDVDAMFLVIDASDPSSVASALGSGDRGLHSLGWILDRPQLALAPLLVVANKQDCNGAISPVEVARLANEAFPELSARRWAVIGASARTAHNVNGAVTWSMAGVEKLTHDTSPSALGSVGVLSTESGSTEASLQQAIEAASHSRRSSTFSLVVPGGS
eukprot:7381681-Prymnesium_polylepis.1